MNMRTQSGHHNDICVRNGLISKDEILEIYLKVASEFMDDPCQNTLDYMHDLLDIMKSCD